MRERSFGIIPVANQGGEYRFLLVQRNEGFWEFPKGHMEGREDPVEAARREFSEETGLEDVEILGNIALKMRYVYKRGGKLVFKRVKYFLGMVPGNVEPKVQKEEIGGYKWAGFEEAHRTLTYRSSKKLLKKAQKYLEQGVA